MEGVNYFVRNKNPENGECIFPREAMLSIWGAVIQEIQFKACLLFEECFVCVC